MAVATGQDEGTGAAVQVTATEIRPGTLRIGMGLGLATALGLMITMAGGAYRVGTAVTRLAAAVERNTATIAAISTTTADHEQRLRLVESAVVRLTEIADTGRLLRP